jgi:predicted DNA-binding transcriptional regulator AlpA
MTTDKAASRTASDEAMGISDVERYTGIGRASVWRALNEGTFPKPHYVLGKRKWWKSELDTWLADQAKKPVPPMNLVPTWAPKSGDRKKKRAAAKGQKAVSR